MSEFNSKKAWQNVLFKYDISQKRAKYQFRVKRGIQYAASVIGIVGLGFLYQLVQNKNEVPSIDRNSVTLELDNGEIKNISLEQPQVIANTNGNLIGTKTAGEIDYSIASAAQDLGYNTLRVPYGEKFKVRLSDGTSVQLNAGSSLRYPVKFAQGENRQVYLNGEAYFEVGKDTARPFIVSSKSMSIRVLGTHFNVSAYEEEADMNTVLVEGAISVYNTAEPYIKTQTNVLKPGQKGSWYPESMRLRVEEVDTEIYTGWREGKLVIRKVLFKDIIRRLERHYDVKILNDYEALNDRVFTATFDIETIEEVFDTFKEETFFEYRIENTEIKITNPKDI